MSSAQQAKASGNGRSWEFDVYRIRGGSGRPVSEKVVVQGGSFEMAKLDVQALPGVTHIYNSTPINI